MPYTITRDFYLEVNAVPLATAAWDVPNFSWAFDSPDLLGGDRLIPDGPVVTFPRDRTVTVYTVPLEVFGTHDWEGNAYADPLVGLEANFAHLHDNLGLGLGTGDGTVVVRRHRRNLDPLIADAHFLGFKGTASTGDYESRTTFDLSVANGWTLDTP